MAGGIDWFRWHHGSVNDPKFRLVAAKASVRLGDVLLVWASLLESASANSERGTFTEPDLETLDLVIGADEGAAGRIIEAMRSRKLLDGCSVVRWDARQPKRERDPAPVQADGQQPKSSTQRSQEHRARKASNEPDDAMQRDATPRNASDGHATPREEESREETSPSLRSAEGASKRATRKCPTSFQVTADLEAWAQQNTPGLDTAVETEKLRDHTFKNAISDWAGTWRNWMRRSFEGRPVTAKAPASKSFSERDADSARQAVSAWTGGRLGKSAPSETPDFIDMEDAHGSLV